jgi:hypothetical protein
MTWHVLPSIGLIVIGVAGMGALQMGVHKLFHGKVLPVSRLLLALASNVVVFTRFSSGEGALT